MLECEIELVQALWPVCRPMFLPRQNKHNLLTATDHLVGCAYTCLCYMKLIACSEGGKHNDRLHMNPVVT